MAENASFYCMQHKNSDVNMDARCTAVSIRVNGISYAFVSEMPLQCYGFMYCYCFRKHQLAQLCTDDDFLTFASFRVYHNIIVG